MTYWASTRANLKMFNDPVKPEWARVLRANPEVDSALLAITLGLTELTVRRLQRRLGLRKATSWKDRTQ